MTKRIGESKVSRRQMSDVERSQIMTHKLLCLISRLSVLLHNNKRCSLFQNRTWFPLKCWTTNSSPVSSLSDKDNIPNSLKVEIKLYFLKKLNIFLNGNLIAIWTQRWWISSYNKYSFTSSRHRCSPSPESNATDLFWSYSPIFAMQCTVYQIDH